jgi:hypothetical protein
MRLEACPYRSHFRIFLGGRIFVKAFLGRNLQTIAVAMITAMVTAAAPAVAHGVQHALFAHNSDKVDGKHAVGSGASVDQRKGKLVATNGTTGQLPNDIIAKALDSDLLDGIDSSGFYAAGSKVADSEKLDGLDSSDFGNAGAINTPSNPVHWTKLKGVPAAFADGDDATGQHSAVQFSGDLTPGQTELWFTFGWPANWNVVWQVRPTTTGGKIRHTVEVERAGDGTHTYWLSITNTGSATTNFEARYTALTQ